MAFLRLHSSPLVPTTLVQPSTSYRTRPPPLLKFRGASRVVVRADAKAEEVLLESPEKMASFIESSELLQVSLGLTEEESSKALNKAFGFGNQGYWRGEVENVVPDAARVSAVLDFLADDLAMDATETAKVVKKFPEVLGHDVDGRLRANVAQLVKDWKMAGPVVKSALLRRPEVLGYSVDCEGSCIGECNRCWARF